MNDQNLVISEESAEAEFERFAEAMDLDLDTSFMDAQDLQAFHKMKRRVVTALMNGSLVIDEKGQAVYTPQNEHTKNKDPITFHEISGGALMAMDGEKKGHDVAKSYAVMGEICKVHPKVFANMFGIDRKVCEALFVFLTD